MSVRSEKKEKRKNSMAWHLAHLRRLRELDAPKWIIKTAQIGMVLNRSGLKHVGIGKDGSMRQRELYGKYVVPLLEGNDDDIL